MESFEGNTIQRRLDIRREIKKRTQKKRGKKTHFITRNTFEKNSFCATAILHHCNFNYKYNICQKKKTSS